MTQICRQSETCRRSESRRNEMWAKSEQFVYILVIFSCNFYEEGSPGGFPKNPGDPSSYATGSSITGQPYNTLSTIQHYHGQGMTRIYYLFRNLGYNDNFPNPGLKPFPRIKSAGITDERVKTMNEIITGMKVIKMYAWEYAFGRIVRRLRRYVQ